MTRHDKYLMRSAMEAAASQMEIKHGAVLVRGGKVIGTGHNSDRSRVAAVPGAPNLTSLHSEVAALHDAHRWVL